MITNYQITNFGPIVSVDVKKTSCINLIIGKNGCGKTFLLKVLYATLKAAEQYQRGKETRNISELLHDKLYWTFQADKIGDLVNKGGNRLEVAIGVNNHERLEYSFGTSTIKSIPSCRNTIRPTSINSIFLPAKEILSIQSIIKQTRGDQFKYFGFDDTYLDLANALTPSYKGKNYVFFSEARQQLLAHIGGKIEYDSTLNDWIFKDSSKRVFSINVTAEGIKKLAILDALLGNHYLAKGSVIFIDEPEANLHPELISKLMDIIYLLSTNGLQFFISTHSYFVIKKLYILAHKYNQSIPVISLQGGGDYVESDLQREMPNNPIIEESIHLYEEEIDL